MKLTILTDNTAGGRFLAEHGLSYYIKHKESRILFDAGHSDVFLKNAKMLGINIDKEIDTIVLSHGHWDHGDGLQFLENKNLIAHPDVFIKRYKKEGHINIGLALSESEIREKYNLITTRDPYFISDSFIFLGEIPRNNDFEAKTTAYIENNGKDDFIEDDSAIAVVLKDELIIISGCAHSGICNIISHAMEITGIKKIKAVIGGFHLKENNRQTQKTIEFFKEKNINHVFPAHCTELPALFALRQYFKIQQIKTGEIIRL